MSTVGRIDQSFINDGLQLGGSLVGLYFGGAGLVGGACAIIGYNAFSRLHARWREDRFPTTTQVVSGIWRHLFPQSTFRIENYTGKLKNSVIGGLVGLGLSKTPYLSVLTDFGSLGLAALGGSAGYIYTDLTAEPQAAPRRQGGGNYAYGSAYQQPRRGATAYPQAEAFDQHEDVEEAVANSVINAPLSVSVSLQTQAGRTVEFSTILEAIQAYQKIWNCSFSQAVYSVAYSAFCGNPQIIPSTQDCMLLNRIQLDWYDWHTGEPQKDPRTRKILQIGMGDILAQAVMDSRQQ